MAKDESIDEQMARIAKDVAWKYARRCWWQDRQEIEQQAWTVVLEVKKHHAPRDAAGEIDRNIFGAIAYKAAMRQLSRWMWRESSPVSTTDHDVKNMGDAFRAPTTKLERAEFSPPSPEDLVDEKRLLKALTKRVYELCGNTLYVRATMLILMEGEKPAEIAKALGIDIWILYRTNEWMKIVLRSDSKMLELAQELLERRES